MRAWGRIVGAALGIPAGVPGIAFGFLIGFLIDKAFENRGRSMRFEQFLSRPEDTEVDKRTGVVYLAVGLLSECRRGREWREEHRERLSEAGGRPLDESELTELLAAARAASGLSFVAVLAWARRNMSPREAASLATLLLLPPEPESGAGVTQVTVARRFLDGYGLSAEEKLTVWGEARPLPRDAAALLDVEEAAGPRELQGAYRLLASQFHPDSLAVLEEAQRREATEAFVRIRGAYDSIRPLVEAWFSESP